MDEAARCTRLGFMRDGRILKSGTPAELRSTLEGTILEMRGGSLRDLGLVAAMDADVREVHSFGSALHLRVKSGTAKKVLKRLPRQIQERSVKLRQIPPTLEDVFISLTSEEQIHD